MLCNRCRPRTAKTTHRSLPGCSGAATTPCGDKRRAGCLTTLVHTVCADAVPGSAILLFQLRSNSRGFTGSRQVSHTWAKACDTIFNQPHDIHTIRATSIRFFGAHFTEIVFSEIICRQETRRTAYPTLIHPSTGS